MSVPSHGTRLVLLSTIAGTGGTLAVHAPDDGHAVYLTTVIAGATVSVGLEDDDVRQLVATLERRLRAVAAARPAPAGMCLCHHSRLVHTDGEGPCLAPAGCDCKVMRPVGTVPFGTVHAPDQRGNPWRDYYGADTPPHLDRAGFWDS